MPPFSGNWVRDMVATVGYVGSAGAKLYWARNINQPDPGPGAVDPRRPYATRLPGVTGITWLESSGNSFFSSLQTTFEKRFSKSFYFLGNWTWSHGLDNVGGDGGANGPIPQDPKNRRADWASSNSDVRHRVNLAASYQLPFGKGMRFASGSNVVNHIVGGWEVGGLSVLQSGLPFTVTVPGSPSNTAPAAERIRFLASIRFRPIRTSISGSIRTHSLRRRLTPGVRSAAIRCARRPCTTSISRWRGRSCSRRCANWSFARSSSTALNHPQFGLPNSTAGVGGAGTITSTQRANRQIQFALRLAL